MGQSEEIKHKWKGTKSFDIFFSVIFIAAMTKVLSVKGKPGTRLCLQ